jgi:U6 snRNA-associated Sm-like protein LSm7
MRNPSAVVGTLKGCDGLLNIVLDDCTEYLRDPSDLSRLLDPPQTRALGLVVCRGTNVFVLCPEDGFQSIENPFLGGDEEEE